GRAPRPGASMPGVDDQDIAVRAASALLAHAPAEQPVEKAGLARPDHDQLGAGVVGDGDELVPGVSDPREALEVDRAARERRARLLEVLLGSVTPPGHHAGADGERR